MMYTHNWALFFAVACGVTWLGLIWLAEAPERRALVRDGLWGFGGTLLLYAPWIPTLLFQAAHTGAPWSKRPTIGALGATFGHMLGYIAQVALLLAAGAGVMALLERRQGRRLEPLARVTAALVALGALTLLIAWLSSQASPAWAVRYLAVALPPLVLLCAAGLAHAGRLGLVGLIVVVVLWVTDGAPAEKSNVRAVAEAIGPSLAPGDLVISTQPEVVPVLHHYLPPGLRYATVWGPVEDVGVSDWRDGVKHLEGSTVEQQPPAAARQDEAGPAARARHADLLRRGPLAGALDVARARALVRVGGRGARGPQLRDGVDRADRVHPAATESRAGDAPGEGAAARRLSTKRAPRP